ncbi:MAG: hypothetical protein ABW164_09935 [Sphingobium sp.]
MASGGKNAQFLIEARLARATGGSVDDCFNLGVAYSCGEGEVGIDLVEAHKWFNIAALGGNERGQAMRAEIAEEMTAREIAEAQRQARAWIAHSRPRAA